MADKAELLCAWILFHGYNAACRIAFKIDALTRLARMKIKRMIG